MGHNAERNFESNFIVATSLFNHLAAEYIIAKRRNKRVKWVNLSSSIITHTMC